RLGKWQAAASDCLRLVQQAPDDSFRCYLLAPILVATTNLNAYQNLCSNIVARFSNTTNLIEADQMAKSCLILPSAGVDLKTLETMTRLAVTNGKNHAFYNYFECSESLAEYRLGNYNEALKWAQTTARYHYAPTESEAQAIIAMAQYNLGDEENARQALTN